MINVQLMSNDVLISLARANEAIDYRKVEAERKAGPANECFEGEAVGSLLPFLLLLQITCLPSCLFVSRMNRAAALRSVR